ncbi:MAG: hypothetical protein ACO3G4_06325 [Opitutaceae bacterium]
MTLTSEPALRYRGGDRHHLFLNHGTWFVRYSVRPSPRFKADRRVAVSLGTRDLAEACERRDAFLAHLRLGGTRGTATGAPAYARR